ncbi:hypothetical protein [Moraxella lacunata]|uniref:hypothetical protein n=1 Tax=Moraxella lacunata TaxID=477 RepID=UPI003EE2F629
MSLIRLLLSVWFWGIGCINIHPNIHIFADNFAKNLLNIGFCVKILYNSPHLSYWKHSCKISRSP